MMETVFPFALLCFTSLFTITSPLSTMPVFLTMTQSLDEKDPWPAPDSRKRRGCRRGGAFPRALPRRGRRSYEAT